MHAYAQQIVDSAPPLTKEQRMQIGILLRKIATSTPHTTTQAA